MSFRPPEVHRDRAKAMRQDATLAETMLWQALRDRQLEGFKFRRQVPLKGYIPDFVCFEARLIVEADGSQHAESEQDQRRDRAFASEGFLVMRFWNDEIIENLDAVCLAILSALKCRAGE